jgi:hypothetical protein
MNSDVFGRLGVDADDLVEVCRDSDVDFLGVFGSVARGEDRPDSDVDLLVRFKPGTRMGFFEWVKVEKRFSEKIGRKTDLVFQDALKPRMRDRIYSDMKVVYGEP